MKPTLLVNAGVGWSATKPLLKTLKDNKCVDHGFATEHNFLYYLYLLWKDPSEAKEYYQFNYKPQKEIRIKKEQESIEVLEHFFEETPTIDNYIDYYRYLSSNEYKGVSDFSNSNAALPSEFLETIKPKLEEYFDVKITMIFRDPVRRFYSEMSNYYRHNTDQENAPDAWKNDNPKERRYWENIKKNYPDSISYWKLKLETAKWEVNADYAKIYNNYKVVFENVHPIIMEDLWNPDGMALDELSLFLRHPLTKLHDNVYYPERGTNRPETPGLRDQWISDMQNLSQEDLDYGRKKLEWVYTSCQASGIYPIRSWKAL